MRLLTFVAQTQAWESSSLRLVTFDMRRPRQHPLGTSGRVRARSMYGPLGFHVSDVASTASTHTLQLGSLQVHRRQAGIENETAAYLSGSVAEQGLTACRECKCPRRGEEDEWHGAGRR